MLLLSSLPHDALEEIFNHLDSLSDVSAARLSCKSLAAPGVRHLALVSRVAARARHCRRNHRATIALRQALVMRVVSRDQQDAIEQEENEDEGLEAAYVVIGSTAISSLLGDGNGNGNGNGGNPPTTTTTTTTTTTLQGALHELEVRRLRRAHRRGQIDNARLAAGVCDGHARAFLEGANASDVPLFPPLHGYPPRAKAARELSSLVLLSPDPVLDLCSAVTTAIARVAEYAAAAVAAALDAAAQQGGGQVAPPLGLMAPPPPPSPRVQLLMARARARVVTSVSDELSEVLSVAVNMMWDGAGGGGGAAAAQAMMGLGPGDSDDDENDDNNSTSTSTSAAGPILMPQQQQQHQTTTTATTADSSVQTDGQWGPSLEVVRRLTRDLMALALGKEEKEEEEEEDAMEVDQEEEEGGESGPAPSPRCPRRRVIPRLSAETLQLLLHFLRRELESWEGLPVPLNNN